jgi:hypothetical protein
MHPRSTVDKAHRLLRLGFTDHTVARMCDVPVGTLRHWKYGNRRAPDEEERRVKGDCPRCTNRELDRAAYAYLLGLYLGDGHIATTWKGVHRIEIACCDGWPGLIDAAAEAMSAVMPILKIGKRKHPGCTLVGSYSKHWHCLFPQHGPGMKHTRKIELEPWQREIVDEFTEEFIRGLIHSDGCRTTNRVRKALKNGSDARYEYPRYFFSNASDDIRKLYTDALDHLGIAWKQNNARNISVAKREAVARLDEFVGPKY